MTFARASLLPAVPVPPHDPRSLRLDMRAGWRAGTLTQVSVLDGPQGRALSLTPLSGSEAEVASPDGSFGGQTWPAHLAAAPDGAVFLLDRASAHLRRFDGCTCTFVTVPHTGGTGAGARQFQAPGGMAACGEMLLVADTGNARVSVFSFFGYVLRGHWAPPPGAVEAPWAPVDVAAARGRVVVTDPANGALHLFNAGGRWLGAALGLGAVRHVAIDQAGVIYVTRHGADGALLLSWPEGAVTGEVTHPHRISGAFPSLPIRFGANGAVDLSCYCTSIREPRYFDVSGAALPPGTGQAATGFAKAGSYITEALDSRIYRCIWDRVLLGLSTPPATGLRVRTHTSEVILTDAEIAALPAQDWDEMPGFVARGQSAETDTLIRSQPGRYLWLRLDLAGDGDATPEVHEIEVFFPRISLRRYLPRVFGEEPVSADFTDRFLALFDRGFRDIEHQIDHQARLFDPLSAPAGPAGGDFLSWLASWIGVTLDRQLPLERRRSILKSAGRLFRLRGTRTGLRSLLELCLGLPQQGCAQKPPACGPCTVAEPHPWTPPGLILEHFTLRRWLFVGAGRLGSDAKLWGDRIVNRTRLSGVHAARGPQLGVSQLKTTQDPHRDPFHVHAHRFSVFLPGWIARLPGRQRLIERLIRAESPAHTVADIQWVAPRFRVGVQSMIGFDSVIGCYPQGITLNTDALGRGTVLSSQDGRDHELRIGRDRTAPRGRTGRIGNSAL